MACSGLSGNRSCSASLCGKDSLIIIMGKRFFTKLFFVSLLLLLSGMQPGRAINFNGPRVPNTPLYDSKLFHFGFSLGLNFMNFSFRTDEIGFEDDSLLSVRHRSSPGFAVGVVTDLRLGKYFNLRFIPTFSMGTRSLEYTTNKTGKGVETVRHDIESIMLFLPLEVKWKAARMNNHRPYVTAGFQYTLDMANRKIENASASDPNSPDYKMKLSPHDVGVTVGVGWDFFLPYNNKVAIELKAFFGFMDVLTREDNMYTDQIDRLNSRMLQLSVTFE